MKTITTQLKTYAHEQQRVPRRTPIWLMRQAGRYLPEYRKIRASFPDFMTFCYTPTQAAEVTWQPLRRFDLDAAIIFSDILVIPDALGQKVSFQKDFGPKLASFSLENALSVNEARQEKHLAPVYEAISLTKSKLDAHIDLFGFAGTPWTLACYMIEEGKSADFRHIKALAHPQNDEGHHTLALLLKHLSHAVAHHLSMQVDAGATIVQLFDSWASVCPSPQRHTYLFEPLECVIREFFKKHPTVPLIYYTRSDTASSLEALQQLEKIQASLRKDMAHECKVDAFTLGFGVGYDANIQTLRHQTSLPLQGNLHPQTLLNGGDALKREVRALLETMAHQDQPFIFNLGHGVIKETPPEHVNLLVNEVRAFDNIKNKT